MYVLFVILTSARFKVNKSIKHRLGYLFSQNLENIRLYIHLNSRSKHFENDALFFIPSSDYISY